MSRHRREHRLDGDYWFDVDPLDRRHWPPFTLPPEARASLEARGIDPDVV